jgi:hypothetical protein
VICDQREQQLLPHRHVLRAGADPLEPRDRGGVKRRREQVIGDEPRLQQVLELGVGAAELLQGGAEDGVRLLGAQQEELASERERGLGPADRLLEEAVRGAEMLDRGVAVHLRLGGAELEQHVGALGRRRRLGERASKVRDGALG